MASVTASIPIERRHGESVAGFLKIIFGSFADHPVGHDVCHVSFSVYTASGENKTATIAPWTNSFGIISGSNVHQVSLRTQPSLSGTEGHPP